MTTAFVANTNVLELQGLHSEIEGAYVNDATVTVTVKDEDGVAVTGQTWPLTMQYVATSQGDYRAILKDTLALVAKQNYFAFIDVNAGIDRVGHWEFKFKPVTRT